MQEHANERAQIEDLAVGPDPQAYAHARGNGVQPLFASDCPPFPVARTLALHPPLGLFAAFIVPLGQIFLAAFLALPARANVPLSALVTFVTNPFTLPFWLVVANRVGELTLNIDATLGAGAANTLAEDSGVLARWLEVGGVTAFGFVVLAVVSAALGYLIAGFGWRYIVAHKRRKRLVKMEQRLVERLKEHGQ